MFRQALFVVPEILQGSGAPEKRLLALRELGDSEFRRRPVAAFAKIDQVMSTGNDIVTASMQQARRAS